MMKNPIRVLIITCWVLLVLALVVKAFGADWFQPSTTNQDFINVCDYIDNHLWLKYTTLCSINLVLNYFTILAILGQKKYTIVQFIIFIPLFILTSLSSWYNTAVYIVFNVAYFVLPIIWLKKRWYRTLIGLALITCFQLISMLCKNCSHWTLNYETTLVIVIMQIDSIIMVVLYYLYSIYFESKKINKEEQ